MDDQDYAPNLKDMRLRVIQGGVKLPIMTLDQANQWADDIHEFLKEVYSHKYTRTEVEEVQCQIPDWTKAYNQRKNISKEEKTSWAKGVELLQEEMERLQRTYDSGPSHLVAIEQKYLSLRVNTSIIIGDSNIAGALQPATISSLKSAVPYSWAPEPVEAVAAAAKNLPGSAKQNPSQMGLLGATGACGWWWFDKPLPIQTTAKPGEREPCCALLWRREFMKPGDEKIAWRGSKISVGPTGARTWFSCFVMEKLPFQGREQWIPIPTASWFWSDDLSIDEQREFAAKEYLKMEAKGSWGRDATGVEASMACEDWFSRFFLSASLWLQQRVLTSYSTKLPRQPGRALARAQKLDSVPTVEVVNLRRSLPSTKYPNGKSTNVDWSCRWLVHGFWRQQFYPTKNEHQTIWIDDFIKGPDDKPLRLKERIYAVTR